VTRELPVRITSVGYVIRTHRFAHRAYLTINGVRVGLGPGTWGPVLGDVPHSYALGTYYLNLPSSRLPRRPSTPCTYLPHKPTPGSPTTQGGTNV
jgi:hypothetical protein